MARIELASAPYGEDCVQVRTGQDYIPAMKKECNAYKHQLERMFPPVGNAYFTLKSNAHDFGTYYEVNVVYDENSEAETEYAFMVDENQPEEWDAEARKELGRKP